jgi:hypothetical protein
MDETSSLNQFPKTHIKPYDGMPVTAEVWTEAHDEHRKNLQAHSLVFHGSGIITGLEVKASDPPDKYVYISAGAAVDPAGNVIVLPEPVAYDFGEATEGDLYLLLGHGEREVGGSGKETRYVQDEFVVAARPNLPKRPAVELARIHLAKRGSVIHNAVNPAHPGADEIDLRFRATTGIRPKRIVRVGVQFAGTKIPGLLPALDQLAYACLQTTPFQLVIGEADSKNYDLLYLAGSGALKLEADAAKEYTTWLEAGGAMIVEAFDDASDKAFKPFLEKLGVPLKPAGQNDPILTTPFLFSAPPYGAPVQTGKKLVYVTNGYSLAWAGTTPSGALARGDIRTAHEWGANLLEFCLA